MANKFTSIFLTRLCGGIPSKNVKKRCHYNKKYFNNCTNEMPICIYVEKCYTNRVIILSFGWLSFTFCQYVLLKIQLFQTQNKLCILLKMSTAPFVSYRLQPTLAVEVSTAFVNCKCAVRLLCNLRGLQIERIHIIFKKNKIIPWYHWFSFLLDVDYCFLLPRPHLHS